VSPENQIHKNYLKIQKLAINNHFKDNTNIMKLKNRQIS
jgi:hypothetical protein